MILISKIPFIVNELSNGCEAWIVGGGARYILGLDKYPKDWDLLIPYNNWEVFNEQFLKDLDIKHLQYNELGGLKFKFENDWYDIWMGDINSTILKGDKDFMAYKMPQKISIKVERLK